MFGHLGQILATELAASGSISFGSGRYDTQLVPDPWSLALLLKFVLFRTPFAWGKLMNLDFFCFLASLKIDAQEMKVVLSSDHVLKKIIRLGWAFLAGAFVFWENTS